MFLHFLFRAEKTEVLSEDLLQVRYHRPLKHGHRICLPITTWAIPTAISTAQTALGAVSVDTNFSSLRSLNTSLHKSFRGTWQSFDCKAHWEPLSLPLPGSLQFSSIGCCLPSKACLCRTQAGLPSHDRPDRWPHFWPEPCMVTCPPPPITAALSAGGEAPGAGEASFPQHSQEAHCMSPGSARGWGWQTFCKCLPTPAPPVASPLQDRGPTLGASFGVAVSSLQPFLCLWVGRCFCGVTAPSHLFPPFNLPEASPTMSRQDTVPLSLYSLHWGNKATLGSPPLGKLKPTFCHRFCVPPWSCKISWEKWHWFWRWQGTCEGFSL